MQSFPFYPDSLSCESRAKAPSPVPAVCGRDRGTVGLCCGRRDRGTVGLWCGRRDRGTGGCFWLGPKGKGSQLGLITTPRPFSAELLVSAGLLMLHCPPDQQCAALQSVQQMISICVQPTPY